MSHCSVYSQAEQTVLALRDLFQVVFEMKKKETEDKKKETEAGEEAKSESQTLDKKKVSSLFLKKTLSLS